MPRLIFVNRYFFPDHSATSQILSDLAFDLAAAGRDVHVVSSTQIYDDPKASLPERETINGITVHRVASTQFGRGSLAGRGADYLSFYLSVRKRLATIARRGDFVVAKTDPPLISIIAHGVAKRTGAHLINWLQDVYPETATELRVPLMRSPVGTALSTLRDRSLRAAVATVAVGERMADKVEARGVARERIHVIPNWCDDEEIMPLPAAANRLRQEWGLADKFVFGYSGNLGRAHEFETVLAAAEHLRDDRRFVFLMVGGGSRLAQLHRIASARGLDTVFRFLPYQDRSTLRYSLGVPDAHWLSLNPKLEGLIVPSKFYGIAAAGKPIVVIADQNGELAGLVRQFHCGFAIMPGDADALVAALRDMADRPELVAEMGTQARRMLDDQFTRRRGLKRWRALIDDIAPISLPAR
jgi:glycosyltransferase involved in cell wall biosynthesis